MSAVSTSAPRFRLRRGLLAAAVALLVAVLAWRVLSSAFGQDPRDVPSGLLGSAAPGLSGPTLAGAPLDLADERGHVVLVNIWAAWCAPCRDELPVLTAAQQSLHDRGLRVVGVDTRDGARQATDLLREVGGDPARSIVDPTGRVAVEWGALGVPETFLVDAAGVVRARLTGAVTPQWIDRNVVPLLSS